MPIRNPFARRPGPATAHDESSRPGSAAGPTTTDAAHPGFERVDTVGSKASSAFSIRSSRPSQDTGEYKMSVVDDSGVYLPPSPIEREEASWPRRYLARTSTDNKSGSLPVGTGNSEIEHFSISRESFDSYRRSFDISAKSPVVITATAADGRQSLDSSLRPPFSPRHYHPRSSLSADHYHHRWEPPTPEESETGAGFEDVGLGEGEGEGDVSRSGLGHVHAQQVKKRGFFAKFGSDNAGPGVVEESGNGSGAGTAMSRFLPTLGGRKRAQSGGQGAELGVMPVERVGGPQVQAQGVEV
ncbi:hypothetical protein F5144DRAFT_631217 [Chaetomium tenue]|uniref:Uncharacterized protein n=1 Tax=Chaetomium tenue TaxID=1854479 RepID=A0ACB7P2M3_9PEZI|nr:hypothetical protein F5144DRAFT_631217 [Chaetomium globosum]